MELMSLWKTKYITVNDYSLNAEQYVRTHLHLDSELIVISLLMKKYLTILGIELMTHSRVHYLTLQYRALTTTL